MLRRWMGTALAGGLIALVAASSPAEKLRENVLASGGGSASGGGRRLQATIGQPAIGISSNATTILCAGFWCTPGSRVVDVPDDPESDLLPARIELGAIAPNPSPGRFGFLLALPHRASLQLTLYDVRGRVCASVQHPDLTPGRHRLTWDMAFGNGPPVSSGVYFLEARVNGHLEGRRRVVIVH